MTRAVVVAAGPVPGPAASAARGPEGGAAEARKVAAYSPAAGPALKGKLRPRGAGKSKAPAARAGKSGEAAAAAPVRSPALAAPRPRPRRAAGEGARLSPIVRACGRSAAARARQTEDA